MVPVAVVPDTWMTLPMRTARKYPTMGSQVVPLEKFWRVTSGKKLAPADCVLYGARAGAPGRTYNSPDRIVCAFAANPAQSAAPQWFSADSGRRHGFRVELRELPARGVFHMSTGEPRASPSDARVTLRFHAVESDKRRPDFGVTSGG